VYIFDIIVLKKVCTPSYKYTEEEKEPKQFAQDKSMKKHAHVVFFLIFAVQKKNKKKQANKGSDISMVKRVQTELKQKKRKKFFSCLLQ